MSFRRSRRVTAGWLAVLSLVGLGGGYGYVALTRSLPLLPPAQWIRRLRIQTPATVLVWPDREAAVGVTAYRILDTHSGQRPAPIASTAKLITALSVLHVRPIATRQHGPLITLSAADVRIFQTYVGHDGSVVAVRAGERITERQMLQAMLLPSADNMADSLAVWAFGSLPAYSRFANAYLMRLGLAHTHVGRDASGLAPAQPVPPATWSSSVRS